MLALETLHLNISLSTYSVIIKAILWLPSTKMNSKSKKKKQNYKDTSRLEGACLWARNQFASAEPYGVQHAENLQQFFAWFPPVDVSEKGQRPEWAGLQGVDCFVPV